MSLRTTKIIEEPWVAISLWAPPAEWYFEDQLITQTRERTREITTQDLYKGNVQSQWTRLETGLETRQVYGTQARPPPEPEPEPAAAPVIFSAPPPPPPPAIAPAPLVIFAAPAPPITEPPPTPILDFFQMEEETPAMPAGVAPSVSLQFPAPQGFAGDRLRITARAFDPDRDLAWLTVRWQGQGVVDSYDITDSGRLYPEVSRWFEITLPESGPVMLRGEVTDRAGNGYTGPWQSFTVIEKPRPSTEALGEFVRVVQETNNGIVRSRLEVDEDAPPLVQIAIQNATLINDIIGGLGTLSPQQLYDSIAGNYIALAAESEARGANVAALDPDRERAETKTLVGYDGTAPVFQQVNSDDMIEQWTETPAGRVNVTLVDTLGSYEPPTPAPSVQTQTRELDQIIQPVVLPGGGAPVPGGISPDFDPVHRFQGYDAQGREVFRLIDEGGMAVQWSVDDDGAMILSTFQNLGPWRLAPAYVQPAAAAAAQPGGPVPGGISPDYDPVHRFQGYDAQGRKVYRLTDEGGMAVQWSVNDDGSMITSTFQNLGPARSAPAYVQPPGAAAAALARGTTPPAAVEQSSNLLLWLGFGAAAYFAFRKR